MFFLGEGVVGFLEIMSVREFLFLIGMISNTSDSLRKLRAMRAGQYSGYIILQV